MKYVFYCSVFFIFLFSGITYTASLDGGIATRITTADYIGGSICVLVSVLLIINKKMYIPKQYRIYILFLLSIFVSCIFSYLKTKALAEFIIHFYIFILSLLLYNFYVLYQKDIELSYTIQSVLWAGSTIALLGLLHFFMFPSWFPVVEGGLSGTFVNTGQAGAYFGTILAIIVPAYLSKFIKNSFINSLLVFLIILALVFTLKRSSIIGFAVGLFLFIVINITGDKIDLKKSIYLILSLVVISIVTYTFLIWGLDNVPGLEWRIGHKFNSETTENFSGFFSDNLLAAFSALMDRPVLGVGLNNIIGVYTDKYEIHSGYLSILSSGGVIGFILYIFFISFFTYKVKKESKSNKFLRYFLPFLIGLMVSWIYTYPLRKREFWLIFFIVSIVVYSSKRIIKDKK